MPEPPKYRVVIAEDNAQIRELLRQQLAELGHTVVGEARDGHDAVTVTARERPDVVVIDWGLPGQDGLAATASIGKTAPTAVVVISANVAAGDPEADAREAGANAYLAKPYLLEDLDEILEQAVRRFGRDRAAGQANTPSS